MKVAISRAFPVWSPRVATAALFLAITTTLAACGNDAEPRPADDRPDRPAASIVEVAQVAGQFSALLRAAEAAGLAETLAQDGPFTVFAPTDGAFANLPEGTMDELLQDPDALANILLYHVVPGTYTVADLREESELESAQGQTLRLETTREGLTINGTYMLTSDVRASNGIIHVITRVLIPGP